MEEVSSVKVFGGHIKQFRHQSAVLNCEMVFSVYLPPQAALKACPVLFYLSGLTCTDQNFVTKAHAFKPASEEGLIIVAPDTSPRATNIDGEDDSWDFGSGAGFYVDATEPKWSTHYNMYSYITKELHELVHSSFNTVKDATSIFGHSMGGHGALICALKNPGQYKSVSAFAPICNPTNCPWGQLAFTGYLGPDNGQWEDYDATFLVKKYPGPPLDVLIDQGKGDKFYVEQQLLPENFVAAASEVGFPVALRLQEGYDHSYFFIQTFMEDHIKHHAKYLH
eukprot:comp7850_c0_seq1/m.3437 comp7850_c0_seq1/g.3437  ORF comp7850_c0_seq1/g.3437 comp7850_c0_seq1/m.3437 type:complete len:280 (-) comp7850_c0_seq1:450-1289(-)